MQTRSDCLLIDNDPDDCDIFQMALQEIDSGVRCHIANDGVEALRLVNNDPGFTPSFIFIDMNMPLMNGRECLIELRKIERFQSIPIYIYSTSADPRSIEEVKSSGANDFIMKPNSFTALVDLLSNLLQMKKSLS